MAPARCCKVWRIGAASRQSSVWRRDPSHLKSTRLLLLVSIYLNYAIAPPVPLLAAISYVQLRYCYHRHHQPFTCCIRGAASRQDVTRTLLHSKSTSPSQFHRTCKAHNLPSLLERVQPSATPCILPPSTSARCTSRRCPLPLTPSVLGETPWPSPVHGCHALVLSLSPARCPSPARLITRQRGKKLV